eukprot:361304-Chlamydomonas_euryale.AAC.5
MVEPPGLRAGRLGRVGSTGCCLEQKYGGRCGSLRGPRFMPKAQASSLRHRSLGCGRHFPSKPPQDPQVWPFHPQAHSWEAVHTN